MSRRHGRHGLRLRHEAHYPSLQGLWDRYYGWSMSRRHGRHGWRVSRRYG